MGAPPNLFFDSLNLKTMVLENKGGDLTSRNNNSSNNNNNDGFLCTTTTPQRANVQRQTQRKQRRSRKLGRVLMKRRSNFDENGIERKVQTLQRLVPTHEPSSCDQGLDGLFRDTASYIISLQMRVRVMQVMVDVLENSQDHHE